MLGHDVDLTGPLPEALRDAAGDVAPIVTPTGDRMWLVRGYALARAVLSDRRFSRADAVTPGAPKFIEAEPVPQSIMSMDGSEHARLRRITAGAFTTGRIAALAPLIERLADERLDRLAAAGPPADLVADFAAHLPLAVLCLLLGVPPEDSELFKDCVEVLFDIEAPPEEQYRRRLELVRYMTRLIRDKRGDRAEDLLSLLIGAHERGDMTHSEMLTMGLTLLMAGFESTIGQIGLMVHALLADPAATGALRERPDLVPVAVEESLRLNPASMISFPRVAVAPVPLGDVVVQPGEAVVVSFVHGNRDGTAFPEPERMVLADRGPSHLAFGHGVHRCLGAPLARLQLRIVVERLFRRFPALRLADVAEPVTWKDGLATRGLSRLLVAWDVEES